MTETITLQLSGLHCNACVKRVTTALTPLAQTVEVGLSPMQATVTGPRVSTEQLISAVIGSGSYTAEVIRPTKSLAVSEPIDSSSKGWFATYKPLLILTAFLVIVPWAMLDAMGHGGFDAWMQYFMAGFFLTFCFFKLLDVTAFANAYAGYDLIASRFKSWGYAYPFVELGLGMAYLVGFNPTLTNWVTIIVMGVSLIGVVRAVINKTKIRCACLGTVFNLPMSTVTIVEDSLMILMAAFMLFQGMPHAH